MSSDIFKKEKISWWKDLFDVNDANSLNEESVNRVNAAHGLLIQEPGLENVDLTVFQEVFLDMFRVENKYFGNTKENDAFIIKTLYNFLYNLGGGQINCLEKAEQIVKKLGPTYKEEIEAKWDQKQQKVEAFADKPVAKFFFLYLSSAILASLESLFIWGVVNGTFEQTATYFTMLLIYFIVYLYSTTILYGHKKWVLPSILAVMVVPTVFNILLYTIF